jgi:hypothetical protein
MTVIGLDTLLPATGELRVTRDTGAGVFVVSADDVEQETRTTLVIRSTVRRERGFME